jgi:hypothetical protein
MLMERFFAPRPTIRAAIVVLTLAKASNPALADCQSRLEAALTTIFTSGPFETLATTVVNQLSVAETRTIFIPAHNTHVATRLLLPKAIARADSLRLKDSVAAITVPPRHVEPGGWELISKTIDGVTYTGPTKAGGMRLFDRSKIAAKDLAEFSDFATVHHYFALTCRASEIDFEYDEFADQIVKRTPKMQPAAITAQRSGARLRAVKAAQKTGDVVAEKPHRGVLKLDPTGRAVEIGRSVDLPPADVMAQTAEIFGLPTPIITSSRATFAFRFETTFTIRPPQ